MPGIAAVIYDFDGVIVDSRQANAAYYNRLLAQFGLPPVAREQMEIVQTRTADQVIQVLFPDPEMARAAREVEKTLANDEIIPLITVEPYVRETLAALKARYRLALATNRGKSLPLVLHFHRLEEYFHLAVSSSQVKHPKPHPDYLNRILKAFFLTPAQAIYIGDAALDAKLAAAVGVPFVAYKNPALPAMAHLRDHRDIWAILKS